MAVIEEKELWRKKLVEARDAFRALKESHQPRIHLWLRWFPTLTACREWEAQAEEARKEIPIPLVDDDGNPMVALPDGWLRNGAWLGGYPVHELRGDPTVFEEYGYVPTDWPPALSQRGAITIQGFLQPRFNQGTARLSDESSALLWEARQNAVIGLAGAPVWLFDTLGFAFKVLKPNGGDWPGIVFSIGWAHQPVPVLELDRTFDEVSCCLKPGKVNPEFPLEYRFGKNVQTITSELPWYSESSDFAADSVNAIDLILAAEPLQQTNESTPKSKPGPKTDDETDAASKPRVPAADREALIVAHLHAHHEVNELGMKNHTPVFVNGTARTLDISTGALSKWFKEQFGSHRKYQQACQRNPNSVATKLRSLHGDKTLSREHFSGVSLDDAEGIASRLDSDGFRSFDSYGGDGED